MHVVMPARGGATCTHYGLQSVLHLVREYELYMLNLSRQKRSELFIDIIEIFYFW